MKIAKIDIQETPMTAHFLTMAEEMPQWLSSLKPGECPDFSKIKSRTFFYPGSELDGSPVKFLNKGHFVHFYVFSDYGSWEEMFRREFRENGFKGYHLFSMTDVSLSDLAGDWTPHFHFAEMQRLHVDPWRKRPAYAFCAVYERDPEYGEEHGCERFAVLFLGEDAFKVYDMLYANGKFDCTVMLLQDCGCGMNYDDFGSGGLMEEIAKKSGVYPAYILKGKYTEIWGGYTREEGVAPVYGGMFIMERTLWKRTAYE